MKRAAMYDRVSTQQQKTEDTIESQKALLLQHAKAKGFEILPEWSFEDNGISGAKLARAPGSFWKASRTCTLAIPSDTHTRFCSTQWLYSFETRKIDFLQGATKREKPNCP